MEIQKPYKLNMRLLAEVLERNYIKVELYGKANDIRFDRIGIFYEASAMREGVVYLITAEQWKPEYGENTRIGFVIMGRIPLEEVPKHTSSIQVLDSISIYQILDILQELFCLFDEWNQNLQIAVNSDKPLNLIIKASEKIFRNPMFIHDNYFFVLAYSEKLKSAGIWETDMKTGRPVVRSAIRNDFQLDQEYLEGLSVRKTVMFSANQRGYQILYHNLYNENRYIGRVLVEEIINLVQPGDYDVMEYLADFLQNTMREKGLTGRDFDGHLDNDIRQLLSGQLSDNQNLLRMLEERGWRQDHVYRCMKLIPNQTEAYLVSNTAIIDRLHILLPDCYSLLYEESAIVIVNMDVLGSSIQEAVAGLAIFLRDNLMKLGISSEYRNFFQLPSGYKQATIALEQGKRSGSTYWYYYFEDYIVEYVGDTMSAEMPAELLISGTLNTLKKYDADNHTELFNTLKVYLRLERNLLQTAKKLFIHRSTLSYRIERIKSITGIDPDNEKERLILLLSFALEEHIRS